LARIWRVSASSPPSVPIIVSMIEPGSASTKPNTATDSTSRTGTSWAMRRRV
jgi:hypothetical protein